MGVVTPGRPEGKCCCMLIQVIVGTHFAVITCFNVARGWVNKGLVYIMHEPKASVLCKRDLY